MAAVTPIATVLGAASAGLGVAQTAAQNRATRQSQDIERQRQDLAAERDTERAAADMAGLREDQARADRDRRDLLRRSQASQRARLGAQGVDADSGSGEALLLGLVSAAEQDREDLDADVTRAIQRIQSDLDHNRRVDLLDRAELDSRSRLSRLSAAQSGLGATRRAVSAAGSLAPLLR